MTIHHVWFHGDAQVGDVELRIGGSPWRTWSRKIVPAEVDGSVACRSERRLRSRAQKDQLCGRANKGT
ncbi:MAG: DUF2914 domain-containing protein [Candidatus Methylomirabilaceae bacterium]